MFGREENEKKEKWFLYYTLIFINKTKRWPYSIIKKKKKEKKNRIEDFYPYLYMQTRHW